MVLFMKRTPTHQNHKVRKACNTYMSTVRGPHVLHKHSRMTHPVCLLLSILLPVSLYCLST